MTELIFVDTNVLIYAVDEGEQLKHEAARNWQRSLWQSRRGRTSFQVLQEFYVNVLKKWPSARDEVRQRIVELLAWNPLPVSSELVVQAWRIQDRYQLSFWDSLIVAAAKATSCRYLLTQDLQADQEFEGVRILNPFSESPNLLD
jgi:predicted nucleic acid-binding protein